MQPKLDFSHTTHPRSGHTPDAIPVLELKSPLLLATLLALGCTVEAPLGEDLPGSFMVVVDTPANLRDQVDLLFVVDDSENMAERQEQLAESFRSVSEHFSFGRGQPDMHIGVISTDMGIGPYGDVVPQCSSTGNGGQLRPLSLSGCAQTGDAFLAIQKDVDGSTLANFEGDIGEAFACMTQLGEGGCEYEQPLKAMQSALSSSLEAGLGFLRPDAVLGVVVLTDEDDCSAYNPELFDPDNPLFRGDDPDFRCFQSGVICDGDDVYEAGLRNGCRPRDDSAFVTEVAQYSDFIKSLKPNKQDRVVTAIIGDPDRVEVAEGVEAQLLAACEDSMGAAAYPGIRLSAFVDSFDELGERSSLCDAGAAGGLKGMVRNLRQSMGTTCLEGAITDIRPDLPGRQVDCRVYEQLAASESMRTNFTECDRPGDLEHSSVLPCYTIQTGGEACGDFRTQLALQIHGRDQVPGADTRLVAECRVDQ